MMMDVPVAAQVNGPSTTTVDEDECEVWSVKCDHSCPDWNAYEEGRHENLAELSQFIAWHVVYKIDVQDGNASRLN
jgi:hypothetical protein